MSQKEIDHSGQGVRAGLNKRSRFLETMANHKEESARM
jgi:hypothetical protein